MIGSIAGDIIGSVYESNQIKTTEFPLFSKGSCFTDDSVLTVAIADAILHNKNYGFTLRTYSQKYPYAGYGGMFRRWIHMDPPEPYGSFGNGSAMRVSPVGFAFSSMEKVLEEAKKSAEVTHNHPEGIKGAQAAASAIFLARTGSTKKAIKEFVEKNFNYNLSRNLDDIRPAYGFDETCQGTVPEAIISFLESTDYESAVRNAVSLGGDSDTLACITGGIAEAFYKVIPPEIIQEVRLRLDSELLKIVDKFREHHT
jgi:ADP-ribosylglycohydrolase